MAGGNCHLEGILNFLKISGGIQSPRWKHLPAKTFWLCLGICLVLGAPAGAQLLQQYQIPLDVAAGTADRQDKPIDIAIDLTPFLANIPGTLDPLSLQVVEVDALDSPINTSVLFQFDPAPGFDPTTNAAGNLVFIMDGTTAAGTTRYYQLAFDLVGACPTCPGPPAVPTPVTVDSLTYQNQLTYEVTTPQATYLYHKLGGGLAGLIDNDTQDWVSFQDIGGSGSAGEFRGIPNMVFGSDPADRFFHPGFTNATSELVSAGPLKVSVRSQAGPPGNFWEVLWDFYPDYARMTVLAAGPADSGPYWFLYEGTVGGAMDAGDVVVRSDGTQTSAFDYPAVWEEAVAPPSWVYFRDTASPRVLFFSDDLADGVADSYRPLGQGSETTPEMTVFGFGRVLNTSANPLVGRLSGAGRSFTMGFVEDHTAATAEIAAAAAPLDIQVGGPAAFSDDFSGLSLDQSLWTVVDPLGDSTVYQTNGQLTLSVAAGTSHDLWIGGNNSARIVQPVADTDIGLEVKFETQPTEAYQIQGLLLEESPGTYIRLDYYHNGAGLHLFAAALTANSPTTFGDITLPAGSPLWLRVVRTGDDFVVTRSADGSTWLPAFSFTHSLNLSQVGVHAGNNGAPAPAYAAVVDYFFDLEAPIDPEDGGGADVWPPYVSDIQVQTNPGAGTALVLCTTNEPASTLLSFGLDAGYGTDVVGTSGDSLSHQFLLTGLTTDVTYHFSIQATDALSNTGATADQQFLNVAQPPVVIDVWGGLNQRVGHLGTAQADFNLMGNIQDWENLVSLTYSVNGGPEQPLNWGNRPDGFGDGRRLARNGDFNVDLALDQLLPGSNTITVHAVDNGGNEPMVTATVTLETGSTPFPMFIDWDTVTDPQDVGQNVDGNWTLDGTGLRTVSVGYDRVFLVGEETWQDYEIVCPITITEVQTPTGPLSGAPGIGFLMRFTGHVVGGHRNWPLTQPKYGYQPFGGIGWLRYYSPTSPTIQFYHGDYDQADNFSLGATASYLGEDVPPEMLPFGDPSMVEDFGAAANILIGETFFMKMRCETLPDSTSYTGAPLGVTRYSYKVWLDTESEPVDWNFQIDQASQYALRQGGPALLAHHVDVTFGDVTVTNLAGPNPPTAVDDALAVLIGAGGTVDVLANDTDNDGTLEPGTVAIADPPLNGSITGIDPVTGAITYLHDGGVALADSFTYTVEDDTGLVSNAATVRVNISFPVPPTAVDDSLRVAIGSTRDGDVVANDFDTDGLIDPTTVVVVTGPDHGTIDAVDPVTGVVTYTHDGGPDTADSFTYTVQDNDGQVSNTATVFVVIEPVTPPVAADDNAFVVTGFAVDITVLANDLPGNGAIDSTTVAIVGLPLNGSAGVDPVTGVVSYTHGGGVAAADSFTYTVTDINGGTSNAATVRVTVSQVPAGEFVSDDFNACDLGPIWTFVDPAGDASPPTIQGAFTGDAKVAINVPSGMSHELFGGLIGAPYIIQETTDNDFTIEVKFDSVLPATDFAEQGIIVKQDDQNWIRLEFYSRGADQLYILAGLPNNLGFPHNQILTGLPAGTSPLYMRIDRAGDTWTHSWSTDGTSWNSQPSFDHPLTVTGVGLYAGNAGGNPAHTVLVDYFSNTLAPISGIDDLGQNTLATNVVGNGTVSRDPDLPAYNCGDLVQLTANPDPGWTFASWSGDLTGNTNPATISMDRASIVTATFVPSGPPEAPVAVDDAAVALAGKSVLDRCGRQRHRRQQRHRPLHRHGGHAPGERFDPRDRPRDRRGDLSARRRRRPGRQLHLHGGRRDGPDLEYGDRPRHDHAPGAAHDGR